MKIPPALQPWIEARKRHRLSDAHVQMAREMGMNPEKLGKLDNHKQELWKAPLPEFIEQLYMKRFGKDRPDQVLSIEESVRKKIKNKLERKQRRQENSQTSDAKEKILTIRYRMGGRLDPTAVKDLYDKSTLGERRPTNDPQRMKQMLRHANLVITAWDQKQLVGIARSFTDYGFVTYMSYLAVRQSHQRLGIGPELIHRTQRAGGPNATLILTAAPAAEDYYPHIGFVNVPQCWILPAQDKLEYYRGIGATNRTEWEFKRSPSGLTTESLKSI